MLDEISPAVSGAALTGARSDQQDTFITRRFERSGEILAVVTDGMGGEAAGAVASQVAAAAFVECFVRLRGGRAELGEVLAAAIAAANDAVRDVQATHPDWKGMGTTLVAAFVFRSGLFWISVGDSPLMLYRNSELRHLNEDHSLRGLSSFVGGRHANVLRSALTGSEIALIDCPSEPLDLLSGDVLLVASDGIFALNDAEICRQMRELGEVQSNAAVDQLLRAVALKKDPKQDNCTILAIKIGKDLPARGPFQRALRWSTERKPGKVGRVPVVSTLVVAGLAFVGAVLVIFHR